MKRVLLGCCLVLFVAASTPASAADAWGVWSSGLPAAWTEGAACDPYVDNACEMPKYSKKQIKSMPCDPYINYGCLDEYLSDDVATRFFRYYQLEWGKGMAPQDPNAPVSTRPPDSPYALGAAVLPENVPPNAFSAWPYGGTENLGASLPNAADSPLMTAIANTTFGKFLTDSHVQIYGWVTPSGNLSSNKTKVAGNAPAAYDYSPNTFEMEQSVLYIERVPDEVQNDHFDWGFRLSGLYGSDYRYTFGYGWFGPNQLVQKNRINGFDDPMMYVDLYWPVLNGLNVRIGRFVSVPDIEAQLAPNNYTAAHSLLYAYDNYTNGGAEFTLGVTKNFIVEMGLTVGTEAAFWHFGQHVQNQYVIQGLDTAGFGPGVDPLFPGASMLKDPGAIPSVTMGVKWTSDDGRDDFNMIFDAWNSGTWGYNNLQWAGFTYYHKFNDYWHIAFETWNIHTRDVPDLNNPAAQALLFGTNPLTGASTGVGYGTPFSTAMNPFSTVNAAWCLGPSQQGVISAAAPLTCTSDTQAVLLYVNYTPNRLNNFSLRTEYFNDPNGQRTGTATAYTEVGFSWQHWLSPQIEFRPEIAYYRSLNNPAFNGNAAEGLAPNRDWAVVAAGDVTIHF
jgi:Putative beta-barrel porin-2, OmpL-like. bbp2